LRFYIRPAALRVRISSRHPGASPSARLRLLGGSSPPRGSQDQLSDQIAWTQPDIAQILTGVSLRPWTRPAGRHRTLRDNQAGQAAARFTATDTAIALSAAAGGCPAAVSA
jgi:hypothetical protein